MKRYLVILLLFSCLSEGSFAQSDRAKRVDTIISQLNIKKESERSKVAAIITLHLDSLQVVFDQRKREMDRAQGVKGENKELAEARSEKAWSAANGRLNKLYATFLGRISQFLNARQTEQLKNLMTEDGLKKEYEMFLEKFPGLADQHKEQIIAYLKEARENAMNAETPQNRREWFIKFRGRANNYLAAAGYDLRKATEELEKKKARGN